MLRPRTANAPLASDAEGGDAENGRGRALKSARDASSLSCRNKALVFMIAVACVFIYASLRQAFKTDNYDKGGIISWFYMRGFGVLDDYYKTNKVYLSATDVLRSGGQGNAGFFASADGFNTDKMTRHNYSAYYDIVLKPYIGSEKTVNVLEIGVRKGGSIKLWRELFSPASHVYGIDISTMAPQFPLDGHIKTLLGSTTYDDDARKRLWAGLSDVRFDIIIDDGDHNDWAQFKTFSLLGPLLKETGVYIIEDVFVPNGRNSYYTGCNLDVSVHRDKSNEIVEFLYPAGSIAGRTDLGRIGKVYKETGKPGLKLSELRQPGSPFKPLSTGCR
jgi:hypothetical protein